MTGKLVKDIESLCAPDIIKTEKINYFLCPERAETFPDLIKRGQKIIDFIKEKHKDGSVLLVTSGDIGKMIYASYYNLD
jgi:broad specificity phosphatase PhoE